jgi:pimeloyl-ACP methyl ester carboxylesterase
MKNWNTCIGCEKTAKTLAGALAILILALETASAATAATPQRHADSSEKGAARLMDKPAPEHLPSETNNSVLGPLVEKWKLLPIELRRYPTIRSNHTVNIAFHIIRQAPGKPVLAFIHGILADYLMWEYITAALAEDYEIWLVDLPGCGDSDAPKPSALESDGYSPTAMADRVWQALGQCIASEAGAPPRQITLVGHSLGGTVVIRMLSAPELQSRYESEQRRIDRAVLFAPCDQAINAVPPSFLTLLGLKGWMVTVGDVLGVFDAKVRELTRRNFHNAEFATIERQERFAHALGHSEHRERAKDMLRQFTPFDPRTLRPIWPRIDRLVADYQNIRIPVLIVHGTWDETLTSDMGHALKDHIPGAMLVELPGRSHSLPTEDPLRCKSLIERFQQGLASEALVAGLDADFFPANPMHRPNPLLSGSAAADPKNAAPSPSL